MLTYLTNIEIGKLIPIIISKLTMLKIINRNYFIINCTLFQFNNYKFKK
jgi:hypothetical protein